MRETLLLAIDQGTTNTKAMLVDVRGQIRHRASRPVPCLYPQSGWVEQDAMVVWESVKQAIDACLSDAGDPVPVGIAISNQRESVLVWDRTTGRPAGPVVIWQCRRSSAFCDALKRQGRGDEIQDRTGLPIDPLFSASKIRWLLDAIPDGQARAEAGDLCAGTIDSWVLWNLTGGVHRCDVSNASRTQLLNLKTAGWDNHLLGLFSIPRVILPETLPSSALFGVTTAVGRLTAGVPIAGLIGDSHAALFGQCGFQQGSVKATYGTGSSLMSPLNELAFSRHGIVTTVAWGLPSGVRYALEGNISVTGSAVQWYADLLGFADPVEAAALADEVAESEGVYIVPAFVGLGAPHWNDRARGLVTGLTRGTTAAHLARAVVESIAYQIRDVFDVMAIGAGDPILLADGGASRNDALMQFQSDILGCPVLRNNAHDLSALGAAYLAGLHLGVWASTDEIAALPRSLDRFEPRWADSRRAAAYDGWQDAVARALYNPRACHG
ncbi:MAG: glycerol kinase GlpK [Rhodothermales bacterium]|nr:glycerol kinase GlpK [Rhodothermales bacterium]